MSGSTLSPVPQFRLSKQSRMRLMNEGCYDGAPASTLPGR